MIVEKYPSAKHLPPSPRNEEQPTRQIKDQLERASQIQDMMVGPEPTTTVRGPCVANCIRGPPTPGFPATSPPEAREFVLTRYLIAGSVLKGRVRTMDAVPRALGWKALSRGS